MLNLCGTKSGREIDKAKETGITPVFTQAAPFILRKHVWGADLQKTLVQPMEEQAFLDQNVLPRFYPEHDLHTLYVGEIETILVRK